MSAVWSELSGLLNVAHRRNLWQSARASTISLVEFGANAASSTPPYVCCVCCLEERRTVAPWRHRTYCSVPKSTAECSYIVDMTGSSGIIPKRRHRRPAADLIRRFKHQDPISLDKKSFRWVETDSGGSLWQSCRRSCEPFPSMPQRLLA